MPVIRPLPVGATVVVTLALLAAALSACGTPRASVADAAKQSHVASVTLPAAKSRTATAPTATSARAAVPTPTPTLTRPCVASDLAIAPAQRHVTEGVQVERFTLGTTAAGGCTLTGVPNLVPKGPLSAQVPGATVDLALSQQQFPDDLDITPPQTTTIALTPGKTASFYLAWFDASSVVCVQSTGFGLNAPGDTTYADLQDVRYPIGAVCDGVFYVSAVF